MAGAEPCHCTGMLGCSLQLCAPTASCSGSSGRGDLVLLGRVEYQSWLSRSALAHNPDTANGWPILKRSRLDGKPLGRHEQPDPDGRVCNLPRDPGNTGSNAAGICRAMRIPAGRASPTRDMAIGWASEHRVFWFGSGARSSSRSPGVDASSFSTSGPRTSRTSPTSMA